MTLESARKIHDLIAHGQTVAAANESLKLIGAKPNCANQATAWAILRNLLQYLLDNDEYLVAATLQWGGDMFNAEPESVKRVFEAWNKNSMILLMGASSMGKTFSSGAWLVLDWLRDPLYTTVKVAAVNEGHLNDNLFAHVKRLTQNCAIPCKHEIHYLDSQLWFGVRDAGFEFGFSGIAFKQSQETSGQFKGYKVLPVRKIPHEKFGVMSRLRVLGDEGQNWPGGPFKDFNSIMASMEGADIIKIAVAFNPESTERHVVQMAEPEHGWDEGDLDTLYDYTSRQGWRVCRLDAAKSENVIARKKLYDGLQTYEGFLSYLKAGGDNSANYWCADTETEVMSKRGWLKHDKLKIGDEIYTANPETGYAEWAPVSKMFHGRYDGDMVSISGRGFSALVTPNHRWAVTHKNRIGGKTKDPRGMLKFKETWELKDFDLIPIARTSQDFPAQSSNSPDFAELAGWVISDGSIIKRSRDSVYVSQSQASNPQKCDRIRSVLNRLGVKPRESESAGIRFFYFGGDVGLEIRRCVTPEKKITMQFINGLDESSLRSLMTGLLLGDGTIQGGSTNSFTSSYDEQAGLFAILAARLGFCTTSHKRWIPADEFRIAQGFKGSGHWMNYVNVRKSLHTRKQNLKFSNKEYHGVIWCPTTRNGTFLARRRGTVYFTGNCFARGFPPLKGQVSTLIPPGWPQEARGEAFFIENPVIVGAADLAFQGKDSAQMAVGRWGLASGWVNHMGKKEFFMDRLNSKNKKPRHVLQIDQILPLTKHDNAVTMAEEIIGRCKMLKISPENMAVDKTSIGLGTYSYLTKTWGSCLGIGWNEGATPGKIVSDDKEGADKQCDGIMSEMWWAFRRWLDPVCRAVIIHPMIPSSPINSQLTSRRYKTAKKGIKVESKDEYKARNAGVSPDEADSLVMLVHLIRQTSPITPGLYEETSPKTKGNTGGQIKLYPVKHFKNIDEEDSMASDMDEKGEE